MARHALALFTLGFILFTAVSAGRSLSDDLYAAIDGLYSFGFSSAKGGWGDAGPGWQTALAYTAYIDVLDWRNTFSGRDDRLDHSLSRTRLAIPNSLVQNDWNDDAGWFGVMSLRYHETFGDTSSNGASSNDDNKNRAGGDMNNMPIYAVDAHNCMKQCMSMPGCQSWAFGKCGGNGCWLKNSVPGQSDDNCAASGVVSQSTTGNDHLGTAQNIWGVLNPKQVVQSGCAVGGMIEKQSDTYISAIASSLNTVLSAKLYYHTGDKKYLDAAIASNKYVESHLKKSDCIADGMDPAKNCQVSQACYTYNSGIYIMGMAALAQATGDMNYWNSAYKFAIITVKRGDWVDSNGVLKSGTNCDDGLGFNSQLVRGVSYLLDVQRSDPNNVLIPFLHAQMNSIRSKDRSGDLYGPQWTGPLSTPKMCTQQTVLSGLFGGFFTKNVTSPLIFQIISRGSQMSIFGSSSDKHTSLLSYRGDGQRFKFLPVGFNRYNIQLYNTNDCLAINGNGLATGLSVKSCSVSDNQVIFELKPTGESNYYKIQSRFSSQFLDTACHPDEGTSVYTWTNVDNTCQQWRIKSVPV